MEKLVNGWIISSYCEYAVAAIILQVVMRVVMAILSAIELAHTSGDRFSVIFQRNILGVHPNDKGFKSDYWFPSILGMLELVSYPVLMVTGAWTVIGAWIGFKTVAQWETWKQNRSAFNRYLIGNALVVIAALLVLVPYVKVK